MGGGDTGGRAPHGGGGRGMGGIISAAPLAFYCACADLKSQWSRYRSPAPVWGKAEHDAGMFGFSPHDEGAGCKRASER